MEVREAAHLTLSTLTQDDFTHASQEEKEEEKEEIQEEGDSRWSRGMMWKAPGQTTTPTPQVGTVYFVWLHQTLVHSNHKLV